MSEHACKPISEIAQQLDLPSEYVEPHGHNKAKVHLDVLKGRQRREGSKYVLVSAITPTPLGEGKTTTTIGLGMALSQLGHKSCVNLRQSSLGPAFGIKGGGAGGGLSKVIPLEESILHVTGDIHAISQAHNQIAALTDASLFHDNPLNMNPDQIQIRRVVDVNDRCLREVTIGQGKRVNGIERATGFDISVASELMAILALVDGQSQKEALLDLRARIGKMVVAFDHDGNPVTAEDLKSAGSATVIMKETLKPTLMQTTEGTPAFLHAGPFANIAHGNSSILADRLALNFADVVVTEAGFGADIGGEKFFNIKCRASGLVPDVAVLVTTIRALKSHSGAFVIKPGKPLPEELTHENTDHVTAGATNMVAQIKNLQKFGIPVVVALNHYPDDHESEVSVVRQMAQKAGAVDFAVSKVFGEGGKGGLELAEKVMAACELPKDFKLLYPDDMNIRDKIRTLAREIYGADGVDFEEAAGAQIDRFEKAGFGNLPICMAKTHLSLSHDPKLKGAPSGFTFPIREVRASAGAGFIYPLAGNMRTMPGLGKSPAAHQIDIDEDGNVVGLF